MLAGTLPAAAASLSLCSSGQRQSPVVIDASASVRAGQALRWHYRPEPLRLRNDGHTLRIALQQAAALQLGNEKFRAEQLHFHAPGGDRLNGESFPFSAHLLHRDARGRLLAVVVLFRLGQENPALAGLWRHLGVARGTVHQWPGEVIDVGQFLPGRADYYLYEGSLTDAPCTENVRWLILRQPLELSAAQLDLWRRHFAANMREPRPLNGRTVWAAP